MIKYLISLLFFVSFSFAESRPCIDTLAGAKYPDALRAIPNHFAIGGFAKTFDDFFPVAKNELERGRELIRVNLTWSDSHSYGDSDIPFIKKEAKRYQILCKLYPGKVELATFTEHNVTKPDRYHDIVQKSAPDCTIVNTPWRGALSKKYKNEVHGTHGPVNGAYNFSYDGTNSVDSNVVKDRQTHSNAQMFCVWHPRLNLKWGDKDTTPRPQRNAIPSKEFLQSLVYLFSNKGPFEIPKKWLVKSHAERHNAQDAKGDKLLIISPIKSDSIKLKKGAFEVERLPYFGSYEGGGYRYYSDQMGFKFGPNLEVYQGGKKYGVINGGFRGLTYR